MKNKNLIDEYCISNSATESELLKIREETYKNEDLAEMISGPLVINFLKALLNYQILKNFRNWNVYWI